MSGTEPGLCKHLVLSAALRPRAQTQLWQDPAAASAVAASLSPGCRKFGAEAGPRCGPWGAPSMPLGFWPAPMAGSLQKLTLPCRPSTSIHQRHLSHPSQPGCHFGRSPTVVPSISSVLVSLVHPHISALSVMPEWALCFQSAAHQPAPFTQDWCLSHAYVQCLAMSVAPEGAQEVNVEQLNIGFYRERNVFMPSYSNSHL